MYHGLRFDPTGRCVEIPGVLQVPPKVRVRSYPVVVRNWWVFFEQLLVAFDEDKRMTTAQSRNMSDSDERMMTLWMDEAPVRFRRLREQLIRDEQTPQSA